VIALAAVGCGKKGPPLAPIVRIPAQVEMIAARRVGNDVFVTVTVPTENIDGSTPGDVERVDIYGYTGRVVPARPRFTTLGTLVASVPVVPAPRPDDPPAPPPDPAAGATQGAAITIRDALTPEDFVQGPVAAAPPAGRAAAATAVVPAPAQPPPPLQRFYLAIPFGPRGRPGPPGAEAAVTLTDIPPTPDGPRVTYTDSVVRVAWAPGGGLIGFLLERELPPEPPPFDVTPATEAAAAPSYPAGPTRYSVYREIEPDPLVIPPTAPMVPWNEVPAAPVSAAGSGFFFEEPVAFEREQCYHVRAVRGVAPALIESEPSPRGCVRPVDVFPPLPPAAPEAVAGEGAISLIWEPSRDPGIGGYLVLRAEAGDATLQPLTPSPIADASFRDTDVMPGRRYVYAIVAVDDRLPVGNMSAPSASVEETAR
jgi:hypothetical protein